MPRRRWHCTCFSECPRIFFISHLSSPLSLDNMHEIMVITFALPATSNTRNVFVRLILNEIFFSLIPPPSLVLFDILFSFENCTWESHRSVWSTSLILTAFAQINFLCVWHAIFENLRNSVRTLWGYSYTQTLNRVSITISNNAMHFTSDLYAFDTLKDYVRI